MRDTIDMIEEARQGVVVYYNTDEQLQAFFQRFEALVRADERALAAPVQEPVAWMYEDMMGLVGVRVQKEKPIVARPVTPLCLCNPPAAQRQWVGLSDDERSECVNTPFVSQQWANIEAKLKEKNT